MKVGIFYNSISNPAKFSNKVMLMDNFAEGVIANGDEVIDFKSNTLPTQHLDAGFVLGYTLEDNFRKKIIDVLKEQETPSIFVDSNILHYSRKEHEWHRYSLNTVYPDTGTYFFKELDNQKWSIFSQWHNVELKPWRLSGNYILVLAQRPKGFNMFTDQDEWLANTIAKIRQYSSRPIMVRMHPGDGTRFKQIEKLQKRYGNSITISEHEGIREALENCWCCVGYASTPNVVSAIEGIPVYVEEPTKSWAQDVCFNDLSLIENPPMLDRSQWINKIANIHWSNDEVKSGKLWAAIKSYISFAR
jgi:hypothetical protein